MAGNHGYSRVGSMGKTIHYDEHGKKTGETRANSFGGATHYDAEGHKIGTTRSGFLGGEVFYDASGHRVGSCSSGALGKSYRDADGNSVGFSHATITGRSANDNSLSGRFENLYGNSSDPPEMRAPYFDAEDEEDELPDAEFYYDEDEEDEPSEAESYHYKGASYHCAPGSFTTYSAPSAERQGFIARFDAFWNSPQFDAFAGWFGGALVLAFLIYVLSFFV